MIHIMKKKEKLSMCRPVFFVFPQHINVTWRYDECAYGIVTTTTILHLNVMVQQAFDDEVNSSFKKHHYNEVVVHQGTMVYGIV